MTRSEYIEWCKNCTLREPSRYGFLCSISGKLADFDNTCDDYILDHTEAFVNEKKQVLEKYDKRFKSNIHYIENYKSSLNQKKKLPKSMSFNFKDNTKGIIFISKYLIIPMSVFASSNMEFNMNFRIDNWWVFSLGILFGIIAWVKSDKHKSDINKAIYLDTTELIVNNESKYKWKDIQVFVLHKLSNNSLNLLIKPIGEKEVIIGLHDLSKTPEKIIKAISKFKNVP